MHGLYRPHGPEGEGREGPAAIICPDYFMSMQLLQWLERLGQSAGAAVTGVLRRGDLASTRRMLTYYASSDAATDSKPPGMGGYMHGFYWQLCLASEHILWLHITVLELLATCFSIMIFNRLRPPGVELAFGADALATPITLAEDRERSEMLIIAHHAALDEPLFSEAEEHVSAGHLRGDANLASDAVSRSEWDTFFALCKQMKLENYHDVSW